MPAPRQGRGPARRVRPAQRAGTSRPLGDASIQVAVTLDRLGQSLLAQQRTEEALAFAVDAVARFKTVAPNEVALAFALGNLADVDLALGMTQEAREARDGDVALVVRLFGAGDYRLCKPYERLARMALADRRVREAERLANRALATWDAGPRRSRAGLVPQAKLDLAEAAWNIAEERSRAGDLARASLEEALKEKDEALVAQARGWLKSHQS